MKLFLYINAKKIEIVIFYFDNYLWKVGIQIKFCLEKDSIELIKCVILSMMKHPFVIFFVGAKSITQVVSSFLVKYEKR